jgi:ABC-2 type transport system permease protein
MTTLVILLSAVLSVVISWFFFRRWGLDEPVITGFTMVGDSLKLNQVIQVSQFEYMILIYSLAWFVSLIISCIIFMISVLVKSTPSSIGIIMSALIGGQFLQIFLADWEIVKYFFVSNLNLTKYLTGSYQFIDGMTFGFSFAVLSAWGISTLIISFIVFSRKDILV